MMKSEVIAEARRRTEEGFFDRQETAREPVDLHWNRITLECGHSTVELEVTRNLRASLGRGIRCDECAEAWIEGLTTAPEMVTTMTTELDFFLMSNLSPRLTGLPFVVWISPRGGARHDVRVKVSHGPKAQPGEFVTVSVRPGVEVVEGELSPGSLRLLRRWIELNREVLVKFWEGEIEYTEDVLTQLRRLD